MLNPAYWWARKVVKRLRTVRGHVLLLLGCLRGPCSASKVWISFASENGVLAQNVTLIREPEIEDGGEFDHGTGLYTRARV